MNDFCYYEFNISKIDFCMKVEKGKGTPIHKNRPFHGLVFLLDGESVISFNDNNPITVKEGQVYYLPFGSDYRVLNADNGGVCIAVNFSLKEKNTFPFFALSSRFSVKYKQKFEECLRIYNEPDLICRNQLMARLYDLIFEIQNDLTGEYVPDKKQQIAVFVQKYFYENFQNGDCEVNKIAGILNISPEYLRKIFKAWYGISPSIYLQNLRIEKAKEIIKTGEIKLNQVSELCGFNSNSYFCTAFRRLTGVSPKEFYRKSSAY